MTDSKPQSPLRASYFHLYSLFPPLCNLFTCNLWLIQAFTSSGLYLKPVTHAKPQSPPQVSYFHLYSLFPPLCLLFTCSLWLIGNTSHCITLFPRSPRALPPFPYLTHVFNTLVHPTTSFLSTSPRLNRPSSASTTLSHAPPFCPFMHAQLHVLPLKQDWWFMFLEQTKDDLRVTGTRIQIATSPWITSYARGKKRVKYVQISK